MNLLASTVARFGATDRRDAWWLYPLMVASGLGFFVVYATYAGFSNAHFSWGSYLSPFYSPLLPVPDWIKQVAPWFTPAMLILIWPAGFRATCYYYRKAYYRSFFFHPPACAVGEGRPHGTYTGERAFPWILQNVHRFFLYVAILFIGLLGYDALLGFVYPVNPDGSLLVNYHQLSHAEFAASGAKLKFGVGVGTLVLVLNVVLLSGYTFGCHSLRHLVGGKHDCFSCHVNGGPNPPASFKAWKAVSFLNQRHEMFAWLSLFSVLFTDFYIRMVSMGFWKDFYILF
ncbi:MAG: succinate dehydrogenase [Candidatus Sericytochromatia bacterium]|nr:succinate dehydrogenase [Candidatus Sericytochromatia bacterium]